MDGLLIVLANGLKNDEKSLFAKGRLFVQRAAGQRIFYSAPFWAGGWGIKINNRK